VRVTHLSLLAMVTLIGFVS